MTAVGKITYRQATEGQYDPFLDLMRAEAANYLDRSLELLGMTPVEFANKFRTIGSVFGIYQADSLAGFYWIEQKKNVLHIHALILRPEFQGAGIGTHVLTTLESQFAGQVDALELGVHESNIRARALYGRLGFRVVKELPKFRFYIMQKRLATDNSDPCRPTAGHRGDSSPLETT